MPFQLTVVCGPRAIGKTHWIDRMLAQHAGQLVRVRTCTTRPRREPSDDHSYVFLTEAEFQERLDRGFFLEHDTYKGFRYGSSLLEIRPVLVRAHGILALTPPGVRAIWEHRQEVPLCVVAFIPDSEEMALRNIQRRGIDVPEQWDALAKEAMAWKPPDGVDCTTLVLTGDDELDAPQVVPALAPFA